MTPSPDSPEPDPQDQPWEADYEMVMPFVTVTSKGGPHDDDAYVHGWECGGLDVRLSALALIGGATLDATVHAASLPQVDLIAMKHGYTATQVPVEDGEAVEGWQEVRFEVAPG